MSATLSEILHWWNLMFLVPIALAVLLLLISATTGMGDGDAEADTSSGHTEADADADSDTDHGPSLSDALRSFGVGVVPVSLLTQAFLLFFGVWGLSANRFFRVAEQPEGRVWLALLVALVVGAVTTALFGAVMRRFFRMRNRPPAAKTLSHAPVGLSSRLRTRAEQCRCATPAEHCTNWRRGSGRARTRFPPVARS
jgi:hypothetical protein